MRMRIQIAFFSWFAFSESSRKILLVGWISDMCTLLLMCIPLLRKILYGWTTLGILVVMHLHGLFPYFSISVGAIYLEFNVDIPDLNFPSHMAQLQVLLCFSLYFLFFIIWFVFLLVQWQLYIGHDWGSWDMPSTLLLHTQNLNKFMQILLQMFWKIIIGIWELLQ